jgi:hypothetical protein
MSHIEKIKYKIFACFYEILINSKISSFNPLYCKQPKAAILTQLPLQKAASDIVPCAISGFFLHPVRYVRNQRRSRKNIHLVSQSL